MDEPIYLRALDASDGDRCHKWHNDRNLYETLCDAFRFVGKHADKEWLDRKTSYSTDEVNLAMCVRETGKHVGNIYLRQIDWISRRAMLHIFIGDREERSKGYGQSAVRQLLSYSFNDLGLRKVHLDVLADNRAAINSYEKTGFRIEGTYKNHTFKHGVWKDVVAMGAFAEDFQQNHVTT